MEGVLVGPGTVLAGRYTVGPELGRGGMATVYLADDQKHHRKVAIKILRPEVARSLGSERFLREIEIAACLTHPNILPLHDSGESGDLLFYVMPYVEGESLRERLQREGRLPVPEALRIAHEVADALTYAHEHGVVHRDIKPGNILLQSGHAVVADFGIARAVTVAVGDAVSSSGFVFGTPLYMSPEQISRGELDGRSDVYSLGCVVYEMVTGQPPFSGPSAEAVAAKHLYEQVPALSSAESSIPLGVVRAIEKALAKQPEDRFQDAGQFAQALEQGSASGEPPRPSAQPVRIGRIWALVALIVALGAVPLLSRFTGGGVNGADSAPSWIVVADFDGPPHDRVFPIAVRELVTAELDQSRVIAPMPRQQIAGVMREAGLSDTSRLTSSLARELAVRSSVRTILSGSVLPIVAGRYSIVLRVTDADSGRTLLTVTRAASDRDLIPAVQAAAREVRRGLGERRSAIVSNKALVQVATPSFPAYRKYVEAVELSLQGEVVASNRLLHEALALDTGFASAWGTIATNYQSMRNLDSAALALAEALRRPARLDDVQLYRLRADSAYALAYDIPAAVRWYDLMLEIAPRSASAHNNRAVLLYALGRYGEALTGFRRTEELELFGVDQAQIEIFNQVATLLALGRDTAAATTAQKLQGLFAQYAAELLATYRGQWSAAAGIAARLADDPSTPPWVKTPAITMLAGSRAARGELAAADRQLKAAAAEAPDPSLRHWFTNAALLLTAASGRAPGPVPSWLRSDTTAGGLLSGGLWAAMGGDTATARARLETLQQRPEVQQRRLSQGIVLLRAYLLAGQGRWNEVAGQLRAAAIAGERDGGDLDQISSPALRWLMADAYQRTGKPDSAKVMYRMAIDPTHLPFSHLALRGLVHSFANRRLAMLEEGRSRSMPESGS